MNRVDWHTQRIAGVRSADLADWGYYDAWASGESALTAAQQALVNDLAG